MTAKLTTLTTNDVEQTAKLNELIAANAAMLTKITAIQTDLAAVAKTGTDADATTALTIGGLQAMLDAQKIQLDMILANTSMYNGDVIITTPAEIEFYMAKIAQLGIVNGNVYVDMTNFSAAEMVDVNKITSSITAVIGWGYVQIVATDVAVLDFSNLTSIKGYYQVEGADVNDANLSRVDGWVWLSYDGVYESEKLSTVGSDLYLIEQGVPGTGEVGTTGINFPIVKVAGGVYDGANPAGVLHYPRATNVVLSGGVSDLTAEEAVTIKLGATSYAGLNILAVKATSVDLSAATGATGPLNITTKAGAAVNLDALKTANVPVTITGPTALSFPVWTGGAAAVLTSTTATDVTLAKHEWAAPAVLAAVKNLTLGNVNANVNLSAYSTLVTASVTGKTQTKWVDCLAGVTATVNPNLTTLVVGGVMNTVSLVATAPATDLIKLTSVTTSGVVNTFQLTDADKITGVTLGHSYFQGDLGYGGPGATLIVTNNALLTALAPTALDKVINITVTGNVKLASVNFSSLTNLVEDLAGSAVAITINNNLLTGTFVAALPAAGTTPYQEAVITSASVSTLKGYVAKIAATTNLKVLSTVNVDVDDINATTAGNQLLSTAMIANEAVSTVIDATGGITTYAEMALVQ
jgi:hypothetical protein